MHGRNNIKKTVIENMQVDFHRGGEEGERNSDVITIPQKFELRMWLHAN
jgi:hypothetical protein